MIREKTLVELQQLLPLSDFVDVVTMQAILHTTKPRQKFAEKCIRKFAKLVDMCDGQSQEERSKVAMSRLMACIDYELKIDMQGFGGCVVVPLAELLTPTIVAEENKPCTQ